VYYITSVVDAIDLTMQAYENNIKDISTANIATSVIAPTAGGASRPKDDNW
jgi:hypothetical protein